MTALTIITADGARHHVTGEPQIIAAAALFLGDGRFRVLTADGETIVPFLRTDEKLRWFRDAFGADLNGVLRDRRADVARALEQTQIARASFLATTLRLSDPRGGVRA